MRLRFLSLFSGVEGASLAWLPLGWECAGVAEVDPFACALLAQRFPGVPNLGDVTKIGRKKLARLGRIDVVVGGFPCQDVSVAGKGKGLHHEGRATRSGLFHHALRIADESGARWTVIENVPGLFTSPRSADGELKGRDFATVVGALAGCSFDVPPEGWRNAGAARGPRGLVEWRVLDAQFFGLAQRRKRVFLVRDAGDWARRPPILLERSGVRWDPAPSEEARQGAAGDAAGGAGGRGEVVSALGASQGGADDNDAQGRRRVGVLRQQGRRLARVVGALGSGSPTCGSCIGPDEAAAGQLVPGRRRVASPLTSRGYPDAAAEEARLVAGMLRGEGHDAGEDGTRRQSYIVNATYSCARKMHARPSERARCVDASGSFASQQGGTVVAGERPTRDKAQCLNSRYGSQVDFSATRKGPTLVVPVTADAASGRSGEARTPSRDAAGAVRLRRPSLGVGRPGEPSHGLPAGPPPGVVCFTERGRSGGRRLEIEKTGCVPALRVSAGGGSSAHHYKVCVPAGDRRCLPASPPPGVSVTAYRKVHRAQSPTDFETWEEARAANTLNVFDTGTRDTHAVCVRPARYWDGSDVSATLDASVAAKRQTMPDKGRFAAVIVPAAGRRAVVPPLTASNNPSRSPQSAEVTAQIEAVHRATAYVRRLTPTECERLQGLPDSWTAITYRKKPASDGPRYRAIGNGFAIPCVAWIGRRIENALRFERGPRR